MRTVTAREAVRTARRTRRHVPFGTLAYDLRSAADPELPGDVRDCLHRLGPERRAVLVLRVLEGPDERSCAELLGVSPGTAASPSTATAPYRRSVPDRGHGTAAGHRKVRPSPR